MSVHDKGILISIEGKDAAGKTTQARALYDKLTKNNYKTILLHEPGVTDVGQYVREYLKSKRKLNGLSELFLFAAARAQLVEDYIKPNIGNGATVITDRYYGSSCLLYTSPSPRDS